MLQNADTVLENIAAAAELCERILDSGAVSPVCCTASEVTKLQSQPYQCSQTGSVQVTQLKAAHEKVLETSALMQARGKAMEALPNQYEASDSSTNFLTTLNELADGSLEACR